MRSIWDMPSSGSSMPVMPSVSSMSSMSKPAMIPELRESFDRGIANMARFRISSFIMIP